MRFIDPGTLAVLVFECATGDKVIGTDAVRSMAERAGAEITEVEGSHVIMLSRPQVVAEAILTALAAAPRILTRRPRKKLSKNY